jgi:hypothetical protein
MNAGEGNLLQPSVTSYSGNLKGHAAHCSQAHLRLKFSLRTRGLWNLPIVPNSDVWETVSETDSVSIFRREEKYTYCVDPVTVSVILVHHRQNRLESKCSFIIQLLLLLFAASVL